MAKRKFKYRKTYPSERVPFIVEYTQALINNCIKLALQLVGLPITTLEWQGKLTTVSDAALLGKNKPAQTIVKAGVIELKQILYNVCTFVEIKCNELGIGTLAADLNIEEYKKGIKKSKPDTWAKNTNQIGVLLIGVNPKKGARKYNIEITKVTGTANDVPVLIDSLTSTSGLRDGFESGALYRIRTQPVYAHDAQGEWSAYILIRIA